MNEFIGQLQKLWQEMGLAQKLILGTAVLAVAVGMFAIVKWSSRPQMSLLYGGVDPKEMAEIVTAVESQEIPYQLTSGGTSILVRSDKVYPMRMEMARRGLPNAGVVGYEIFDRNNFGISDFVQRTNYIRAIQGELSRTISQLKGVKSARVMVVVPENKLLVAHENDRPTASVFVDTGSISLDEESVNAIRFLVANSVEGLAIQDVAVVDSRGNVLSDRIGDDHITSSAGGQLKFRKNIEDYYTKKIETMLAKIVGAGNVVARVTVDVNNSFVSKKDEIYDPDVAVPRVVTQTEDNSKSSEQKQSQVVGASANEAGGSQAGGGGNNTTQESRTNRTTTFEINKSIIETINNPGEIKSMTAAVFIAPKKENGKVISRNEEEIKNLQKMVANALGIDASNAAALNNITVKETAFAETSDELAPAKPSLADNIMKWVELSKNYTAVFVALIIFVLFSSMVKKYKREQASSLTILDSEDPKVSKKDNKNSVPRLTPDVLNELIREKPENVSTALKEWMANELSD